ncbi:MAG: TIR domain-containing protein [Candidatus Lokiarchaeota archaeon]|nr:TIR domain-containing protein [Candidatus Lokiarchaeota archaeon]
MKYLNIIFITIISLVNFYLGRNSFRFSTITLTIPIVALTIYYCGKKKTNNLLLTMTYFFVILSFVLAYPQNLSNKLLFIILKDIWALLTIPALIILIILNFRFIIFKNIFQPFKNKTYLRKSERSKIIKKPQKVFISYNHKDKEFVLKLKKRLEERNIRITIDIETMEFGEEIMSFIDKSMKETDFTISIVSKNSLRSAWVIVEALETLMYEKVEKKTKFVPLFIDKSFFNTMTQNEIVEEVEKSIKEINEETIKLSNKFLQTKNLDEKRAQLIDVRYNIDKILSKLNSSLVADFSSDDKFNENLPKLIEQIKNTTNK